MGTVIRHVKQAFTSEKMHKFIKKITNRNVVVPITYSLVLVIIFASIYALIGYNNIFETTSDNKDKNIRDSISTSIMFQTTAVGFVTPKNDLGMWLMNFQVLLSWLWSLCLVYIFVGN